MKKEYTKPLLFAESFELMEHISQTCGKIAGIGGIATHWDNKSCGFRTAGAYDDSAIVFASEPTCNQLEAYDDDFIFEIYHGADGPTSVTLSEMFSS